MAGADALFVYADKRLGGVAEAQGLIVLKFRVRLAAAFFRSSISIGSITTFAVWRRV
jgi:hypothetical protein